jgi:hypothetical protein
MQLACLGGMTIVLCCKGQENNEVLLGKQSHFLHQEYVGRPMILSTESMYASQNLSNNYVQCVINVRVTYLVYVLKRDIIVIGNYIHVQLRYMSTYDQWNI